MKKTKDDIIQFLHDLEEYLVKQKDFDFKYFPVVRIQIGYYLHLLKYDKLQLEKLNHTVSFKIEKFKIKNFFTLLCLWFIILTLKIYNRNLLKGKVLLVGYAKHYYTNNNKPYNLYISPIKQELSKTKIKYEEFQLNHIQKQILHTRLRVFYDVLIKYNQLLFRLKNNTQTTLQTNVEIVQYYLQNNHVLPQIGHFINSLYRTSIEQEVQYKVFITMLQIAKPKLVWDYCYYDNAIMALNRAANTLKIRNIEYQHSIQGNEHFAYAKWYYIDKYSDFFPETFAVWSESHELDIRNNFTGRIYKPNTIVTGNLAVASQKKWYNYKTNESKKGILISLQGMWIPDFVQQVIEQDDCYKWYFRLHPRYPEDKMKLINFNNQFPNKIEIDEANNLSLYELFTKVNTHITHFSGVALEAEEFGIKNIIIGEKGKNVYKEQIQNNKFLYADSAADLKQCFLIQIETSQVKKEKTQSVIEMIKKLMV